MAETSLSTVFANRKAERLESGLPDTLSARNYNLALCGTLTYGLVVNALMVYFLYGPLQQMASMLGWLGMLLVYLVPTIAGIIIANRSTRPLVSFLGYNLVVLPIGLMLALVVPGLPAGLVVKAMGLTAMVTLTMTLLAVVRPQLFLGIGRTLFIALLVGLLAEVVATFLLGYRGAMFDWLFVLLFSGYIGYDVARSQVYPKTLDNAIDCALDVYLDVINLFIRLLSILARRD